MLMATAHPIQAEWGHFSAIGRGQLIFSGEQFVISNVFESARILLSQPLQPSYPNCLSMTGSMEVALG
jgi:hypothetical protein